MTVARMSGEIGDTVHYYGNDSGEEQSESSCGLDEDEDFASIDSDTRLNEIVRQATSKGI